MPEYASFFVNNEPYISCLERFPETFEKCIDAIVTGIVKKDGDIVPFLTRLDEAKVKEFIALAQKSRSVNILAQLLEYNNNRFGGGDPLSDLSLD